MKGIVRSQLYQLVVDKAIFLILIIWGVSEIFNYVDMLTHENLDKYSSGELWILWVDVNFIFVMLIAALVMTKDFVDQTINYDILAGNTRWNIFFGRFMTAVFLCEAAVLVDMWFPSLIHLTRYEWGTNFPLSGALMRTLFMMLAVFRCCGETALLTMLFRRKGIVYFMALPIMLIGDLVCAEISYAAEEIASLKNVFPWLSVFTLHLFEVIPEAEGVNVLSADGAKMTLFSAYPEHMGILFVMSFGIGLAAFAASYHMFKKKDLE